eukprot:s646_g9.t1
MTLIAWLLETNNPRKQWYQIDAYWSLSDQEGCLEPAQSPIKINQAEKRWKSETQIATWTASLPVIQDLLRTCHKEPWANH